ncbi:MAG: hypothetical protein ABI323_12230 [Solirubrobacteraceae bacterium]
MKVVSQPRGGWVVIDHREVIVSEHRSATEAELAAMASLCEGDELVVYDRYHRCRTVRSTARR